MKIKLLLVLSIFAFSLQAQNASKEAWESMFNGKDLTNWTPKIRNSPAGVNYGNTFRVEDGKLVVRYDSAAYHIVQQISHPPHERYFHS